MNLLLPHKLLRLIAFTLCSIFLLQIATDIVVKIREENKKQELVQKEKSEGDDSSNDDQEKEKETEIDDEDEKKELNQLLLLAVFTELHLNTLQKHLKHCHLPSGFFKTFTPPPENSSLA